VLLAGDIGKHVTSVGDVSRHEDYGWGFDTRFQAVGFYNVVNADDQVVPTFSMDWYWLKRFIGRRPPSTVDAYSVVIEVVIEQALKDNAHISDVHWETG